MRPKTIFLLVLIQLPVIAERAEAQVPSSAREVALGAWVTSVRDAASIDLNPAGLMGVRDWESLGSTYVTLNRNASGFVFQDAILAKRFLESNALAFRYSPGVTLSFHLPDTNTILIPDSVKIPLDKSMSFRDVAELAYAKQITPDISLGIAFRTFQEEISMKKIFYVLDAGNQFVAQTADSTYTRWTWLADLGVKWQYSPSILFGAATRNLLRLSDRMLPSDLRSLSFRMPRILRIGAAYSPIPNLLLALDMDTEKHAVLGWEYQLPHNIALRQSTHIDATTSRIVPAIGLGIGWSYRFVELNAAWLHFTDQRLRNSQASFVDFETEGISNLVMNSFTDDRIVFSLKVAFGKAHEPVARIEDIELTDIYPSMYYVYAYRPVGRARVRNLTGEPVRVRLSFMINDLMNAPTETKPEIIPAHGLLEIPFTALFKESITREQETSLRAAEIAVESSPEVPFEDRAQVQIVVHGRNDWDGDPHTLQYFVTPTDPAVLAFSRSALEKYKTLIDTSDPRLNTFLRSQILFSEFANRLTYVNDPRLSDDRVQYPAETISLKGGDCDDMSVAFASILESVGIASAFVDIVPPEDPENAHVFIMFDTGLPPKLGSLISDNPKRYVIRKNSRGEDRIWIPLETTEVTKGFESAWKLGAEEYFENVELKSGLIKGWVHVIDIDLD
ncbi:MAG: hypothetical protein ACPL4I_06940 [Bacteroidota bacterium]